MGFKKLIVVAGLVLPALACASVMNLFSGFSVVREVVIEPQQHTNPGKIVKSADGGYFVTTDWAVVKTDAKGSLLWTTREPPHDGIGTHYGAIAPATDGGVLICGTQEKWADIPGKGSRLVFSNGLVVRLDKNGHEMSRIARPAGDQSYANVTFKACARWGDDFVVIGDKPGVYTVLRLHSDGALIWQKEINLGHGATSGHLPQAMPNGDLVFLGIDSVARIDSDGNLRAKTALDVSCNLLMQTELTDQIKLICYTNIEGKVPEIVELNPDLQVLKKTPFPIPDDVGVARAYVLPDGSLILFGSTRSSRSNFIPAVFMYSPTGSLIAKHAFEKREDEGGIEEGVPTGVPGEFVMIRPTGAPDARTTMTFLHKK